MRTVERGHPMFGPACDLIRAEALIRIDCEPPLPRGLLALGQRAELSLDARHGSELLMFLGRSLAAMIRRWLIDPHETDDSSGARAWPRAGPAICNTTAGVRRTRCAPMSRRRIGSSTSSAAIAASRSADALTSLDLQSRICARSSPHRRAEGLGASRRRASCRAVRAFLKYAAEQQGSHAQLPRTRAPKRPRTLPRPASPEDAMGLADDAAAAASAPWIGARDLAILLLLYGAGLRVAEALSLTRARAADRARRCGSPASGPRRAIVPIVPAVREAIEDYARQCPYPLSGDAPLFVGARGGPLNPRSGAARGGARRGAGWGCPIR